MPRRTTWTVAAVQMTATEDRARNLRRAAHWVRAAAAEGADLVALPENFSYLRSEGEAPRYRDALDGELVAWLRDLAREVRCYLLAGSIPERASRHRVHNTSLLLGPTGAVLAVYRKLHLFDVSIPGRVEFRESRTVAPGNRIGLVRTPLGVLGLTVCYDLRFPELYRQLALRGAEVIFVPSAFTAYTGRSHWLPLLQARAIECQAWVVAPAQVGRHNPRRESFGHTAVLDPWGRVVALKRQGEGWVSAEVDLQQVARVRRELPCLRHVRRELWRFPRVRRGGAAGAP